MGMTAGILLPGVVAATLAAFQQQSGGEDLLYGRVVTAGGEVHEGFLRWDRNEATWADLLDGYKDLSPDDFAEADRLRREAGVGGAPGRAGSIEFLGVRVTWEEDDDASDPGPATSGVRFGHVRSLRVLDGESALLTLKSGDEVRLRGSSTDLGSGFRGLALHDPRLGQVVLGWTDLDVVEFRAPPPDAAPPARRLHGTVRDRRGNAYTGYVTWNVLHVYTSDVLEGKVDGRARRIPFGSVAAIERAGSGAAIVTSTDGERSRLEDGRDVDARNGGIDVSDPGLGQVRVGWGELDAVRFHAPDRAAASYAAFDGGRRLRGTVLTEDGESFTGWIRWDNDEAYTWEILDGEHGGVTLDVELGNVAAIEKISARSALVTLRDGRAFELEGSNDVDRGNKGIVVGGDDGAVLVPWYDFRRVSFEHP